jgi:transcriptional regulator with XRE-family HTH domain
MPILTANRPIVTNMTDTAIPIRAARQARDLSQEKLARLADCSTISVRNFERGLTPTRSEVLPRILAVLGLDLDRTPDI